MHDDQYCRVCGSQVVHFFFQAEDGIRDYKVTGVQTCALPISQNASVSSHPRVLSPQSGFTQICVSSRTRAMFLSAPVISVVAGTRSEEHTSELQSPCNLVCRLLLEKKKLTRTSTANLPLPIVTVRNLSRTLQPPECT